MDYGAAVSQKGYDVKTCADRFLVYSSKFQTLKIFNTYAVSTTVPSSGTNTITINHNLGFFAPFLIIYNGSSTIGTTNSYFFTDRVGRPIDNGSTICYANNTINTLTINVGVDFDGADIGATVYFTVYLFLNDFSTISHSEINTGTSSGASSTDYGIRVSKDGYDVKTCNDIDCVFSSSFFNQIIDQQKIYTASGGSPENFAIDTQGFLPSFLSYIQTSGQSYIYFAPFWVYEDKLERNLSSGDKVYYIIFKQQIDG